MSRKLQHTYAQVGISEIDTGDLFVIDGDLYEAISTPVSGEPDDDGDRLYQFEVYDVGQQRFKTISHFDFAPVTLVNLEYD